MPHASTHPPTKRRSAHTSSLDTNRITIVHQTTLGYSSPAQRATDPKLSTRGTHTCMDSHKYKYKYTKPTKLSKESTPRNDSRTFVFSFPCCVISYFFSFAFAFSRRVGGLRQGDGWFFECGCVRGWGRSEGGERRWLELESEVGV